MSDMDWIWLEVGLTKIIFQLIGTFEWTVAFIFLMFTL